MRRLPDILEESPDAFLPDLLRGQLVEAEHFARYAWASQFVSGRSVLDAGCGVAAGTRMLAEAGATRVIGVDRTAALLEMADIHALPAVRLLSADVRALPLRSASVEVIIAFGLLEQTDEPNRALAEMLRVLGGEGVIAVSVPPASPHEELGAASIRAALGSGCAHTVELSQRNWTTSAIIDERQAAGGDRRELDGLSVRRLAAASTGSEVATVILASRGPMPAIRDAAAMTHAFAHERWLDHGAQLEAQLAGRARLERELRDARRDRAVLADRLIALEQQIARSAES